MKLPLSNSVTGYTIERKKVLAVLATLTIIYFVWTAVIPSFDLSQSSQPSEDDYSINFMSEPVANQLVRVKVENSEGPLEDAEVRIDGSVIGSTDEEGLRTFEVPEKEFEIQVLYGNVSVREKVTPDGFEGSEDESDSDSNAPGSGDPSDESGQTDEDSTGQENQTDEQNDEQNDEDAFTGIRLSSDPVAGETNRVEALEDGEALQGREVMLDGKVLGETNSLGQVQFSVPDRSQITLEVAGLGTEEFQVKDSSSQSVSLNDPADGKIFTVGPDESQNIEFSFSKPENSSYRLYLDGEIYMEESLSSSSVQVSEALGPGSYTWFVRSDGSESDQRSFRIKEEGTSINIIEQATEVDGYILDLAFEIEGEASSYELYVNNNLDQEGSIESTMTYSKEFENPGTQDIRIEAFESGELKETLQRSFETSAPPEATVNWMNPSGSVDTTTPEIEYEIDAGTDYQYDLYLNSQLVNTGEASETNTHTFTPDPLPKGTHSYEVKVFDSNDREIGNTSGTFETTTERKLVEGDFSYRYSSQISEHQIFMDMEAYEDLEYTITVNGTDRVNKEFTGSTTTRAEDIGSLESGQQYTAEILFESLETSKTHEETVEFTAE